MEVIEERIIVCGIEFTKSELEDIAQKIVLGQDGRSYVLDLSHPPLKGLEFHPKQKAVRKSKGMQKALKSDLFKAPQMGAITLHPELLKAVLRYRKRAAIR